MNIASFSINRPIFIASLVILMLFTGLISLSRLGVDLFPDVNIPIVSVSTVYTGAAPEEIENLISKPLEDQFISISGLKRVSSRNLEGLSVVICEFTMETDIKYAEQQVRDRTALARPEMPDGVEEPLIQRFDPTDIPVARLALSAGLPPTQLYDLAREKIKVALEQVNNVGTVKIIGGVRREIQVELDQEKLNQYNLSATNIANKIKNSGSNVPIGKHDRGPTEVVFRTLAQFEKLKQIEEVPVSFAGDLDSVRLRTVARVRDGAQDETSRGFLYAPVGEETRTDGPGVFGGLLGNKKGPVKKRESKPTLLLDIYKQSGANTVEVADGVMKKLGLINEMMKGEEGRPRLSLVYDGAKWIRININDVFETIIIGIALAVFVVYLFLGNVRSTIITGIALPNSLLGAFILMYLMNFTVNMLTLLALSLTVGLLVDDAIVVRENIFRKLEEGMRPVDAAEKGTMQVALAVIATTLTIVSVFFPIGFLKGIVGQFFKQFGLTVVFAMFISLFDAMTVAPLLSAYFAGKDQARKNRVVIAFDRFQSRLEEFYGRAIDFSLRRPLLVISIATVIFLVSLASMGLIKKTFMPETDQGEFMVNIEMPPGTSLDGTQEVILKIEERLKTLPEIDLMSVVVGGNQGEANLATIGISLVPAKERTRGSLRLKELVRKMLGEFAYAKVSVTDYNMTGGQDYPFVLVVSGNDLDELESYTAKLMERLRKIPDLIEFNTSSQGGKPEFQVRLDPYKMQKVGVESGSVGLELRYHVAGFVVGKLHENGIEYDVRLRLNPEQRDLRRSYRRTKVPNVNSNMVPLAAISIPVEKKGPSYILRQNRARVIQISANIAPGGGVGNAIDLTRAIIEREMPLPKGMSYSFIGETESYGELIENITLAFILSFIFIYLVLSSLYESFVTPATILMAIPPAISGAFFALLITNEMFSMMSMIGMIMLMGLVTKNSILLVDFAMTGVRSGLSRGEAIRQAGIVRLRPILMTTFAMIAGTLPVALGWGEASKFRASMGISVVGGLIVSTLITLLVVPAIFGYVDRVREWIESRFRPKYDIASRLEPMPENAEREEQKTRATDSIDSLPGKRKKAVNKAPGGDRKGKK